MSQSDIPDENRDPNAETTGDATEAEAQQASAAHPSETGGHTPLVAEQAYAEQADAHIVSSAEPASEPLAGSAPVAPARFASEPVSAEPVASEPAVGESAESSASRHAAVPAAFASSESAPVAESAIPYPTPPAAPAGRTSLYVQAPTAPQNKGNRGFGILVSLLATIVFAALYAGILALVFAARDSLDSIVADILLLPPFWIPVIFFFLAMSLLSAIVNRGGWWAWILGGFLVAAIVYGSYLGGVLIYRAMEITPEEVPEVVRSVLLSPAAIISFLVAREVPIWFGAWISARGRTVRERNAEAQREYQRVLDEGPVVS